LAKHPTQICFALAKHPTPTLIQLKMPSQSDRQLSRLAFAERALGCALQIAPASVDASFRSYWRVSDASNSTHIVMDAPVDREDCRPFIDICARLHAADLRVPVVLAQDLQHGFLLLPDLGVKTLLPELSAQSVDQHYQHAMASILQMQTKVQTVGMLPYDATRLQAEMALFPEWFLSLHLGAQPTASERELIEESFAQLSSLALSQPAVFVHRDFHSRNLMLANANDPMHQRLSVIDFQDALIGPITYDLVSLLKDCYVSWSEAELARWLADFHARSHAQGLHQASLEEFTRWFDWMGVQRHLKVLGIFARLNYRDGKPGYLKDLPLVLHYTLQACARYPELREFGAWLRARTAGVDLTRARDVSPSRNIQSKLIA
jgi:N-acetylmuramate 1-kinase